MNKGQQKKETYSFGKLAGKKPAEFCYKLEADGIAPLNMKNILERDHQLGEGASGAMLAILKNQKFVVENSKLCSLNILFPEDQPEHVISVYVNSLIDELNATRKIISDKCFIVESVFVGQGALLLPDKILAKFLECCAYPNVEFTLDVGKCKALTQDKMDILLKYGVNSLSFDVASFVEKTRSSTKLNDFLKIYKICLKANINVNLHLLNGLGSETWQDFTNSLGLACELSPVNLSVSTAPRQKFTQEKLKEVTRNTWRAYELLQKAGYSPYAIVGEQAGEGYVYTLNYCKSAKVNKFRVFVSRGRSTVIGVGMGAESTKADHLKSDIVRLTNTADLSEYVFDINTVKRKKEQFF